MAVHLEANGLFAVAEAVEDRGIVLGCEDVAGMRGAGEDAREGLFGGDVLGGAVRRVIEVVGDLEGELARGATARVRRSRSDGWSGTQWYAAFENTRSYGARGVNVAMSPRSNRSPAPAKADAFASIACDESSPSVSAACVFR